MEIKSILFYKLKIETFLMKRLVILQSKKHITHYKKYHFLNSDTILSLDPFVHFEVDKNKWNKNCNQN